MFRLLFRFIKFIIKIGILIAVLAVIINLYVIKSTDDQIIVHYNGDRSSVTNSDLVEVSRTDTECIMVLGAAVNPDGTPSQMLKDRLETASPFTIWESRLSCCLREITDRWNTTRSRS